MSCPGDDVSQAGGRSGNAGANNMTGGAGAIALAGDHASTDGGGLSGSGGTLGAMPNIGGASGSQAGTASGGAGEAGETASEAGAAGAPAVTDPTELAQGKPNTTSTQQLENPSQAGNDGSTATRWSSANQTLPQWWRVDLESEHQLSDFSIQWEHPEREYWYEVEVSSDDKVFKSLMSLKGTGQVQTAQFPEGTKARYMRITCTNALPSGWASFYEVSVRGF